MNFRTAAAHVDGSICVVFRSELAVPIYSNFGVSGGTVIYDRTGIPYDYPKVQSSYIAQQLQFFWRSRFGELL